MKPILKIKYEMHNYRKKLINNYRKKLINNLINTIDYYTNKIIRLLMQFDSQNAFIVQEQILIYS